MNNLNCRLNLGNCFNSIVICCLIGLIAACSSQPYHSTAQHTINNLSATALSNEGLALISPSTVTGREEDKQAVAFIVSKVIANERPSIRLMSLPETLGAVNNAGLATEYREMIQNYHTTGLFDQNTLNQLSTTTNARFFLQLNLSSFNQGSHGRFSMFGFRLFQTKFANIRIFFQIWDAKTGSIVWEGVEELSLAEDTSTQKVINFTSAVAVATKSLVKLLPAK